MLRPHLRRHPRHIVRQVPLRLLRRSSRCHRVGHDSVCSRDTHGHVALCTTVDVCCLLSPPPPPPTHTHTHTHTHLRHPATAAIAAVTITRPHVHHSLSQSLTAGDAPPVPPPPPHHSCVPCYRDRTCRRCAARGAHRQASSALGICDAPTTTTP
jgi:hypothetical protein